MLYKTRDEAYRAYREAPDDFFEQYHQRWFNEKDLISPDWTWFETKYHYNLVENSIIDLLRSRFTDITNKSVLDVGAGTGHWIEFYRTYLDARITGVDFSGVCVRKLASRYAADDSITVEQADIAVNKPHFTARFDIINAIGVMFHLVDDEQWRSALANLVSYLDDGGIAIIGGEFGAETRELGVMRKHRSRQLWEAVLNDCGARLLDVRYHDWFKGGLNDGLKNNLLAFARA